MATTWQHAVVEAITPETARVTTFTLRLEQAGAHRAGQHFVVRLTAPDGYTASRSYSVASAPDPAGLIDLTVERLDDGEVSTFLHDVVEVGDELEVRGPIGNWFVWDGDVRAVLVGGGSGVVPLMSMLRHARRIGRPDLLAMVVSVRSPDDLVFARELDGPETTVVYSRRAPAGSTRPAGRLTVDDLPAGTIDADRILVCGSAGFADHATSVLLDAGVAATAIRVERFGPVATPGV